MANQFERQLEEAVFQSFCVETREEVKKKGKTVTRIRHTSCERIMARAQKEQSVFRARKEVVKMDVDKLNAAYAELEPREVSPFGDNIVIGDGAVRLIKKIMGIA